MNRTARVLAAALAAILPGLALTPAPAYAQEATTESVMMMPGELPVLAAPGGEGNVAVSSAPGDPPGEVGAAEVTDNVAVEIIPPAVNQEPR